MSDRTARIWFCGINGKRIGPMSLDDLQGMVDRGELIGSDLVWCPDFGDTWRPAESVEEIDFSRRTEDSAFGEPPPMDNRKEPEEPIIMPSTPILGIEGAEPSAREAGRRAWQRMKAILFQPFSFARWCGIALAAWIASIGSGGINININANPQELLSELRSASLSECPKTPEDIVFWLKNLLAPPEATALPDFSTIGIIFMALIAIFSIVVGIVLCWVRARGTFAVLHKIHRPNATWNEAWQVGQAGGIAKSLFLWRLCIGAIFFACLIPAGIAMFLAIGKISGLAGSGESFAAILPTIMIWVILCMILGAAYSLVMSLTKEFMEPIMYWRQIGAMQAWKVMNEFCSQCAGAVFRYYIMLCAWWIAAFFMILGIILCSLGTYLLLLIVPFVNILATLPVTIFFRATGLEMLRQWRPDLVPDKLDKVARFE